MRLCRARPSQRWLAIVAKQAPKPVQEVLRQGARHIGDDYELMRRALLAYRLWCAAAQ